MIMTRRNSQEKNLGEKLWDLKVEIFSVLFGILATYLLSDSKSPEGGNTTIINNWNLGKGFVNILCGCLFLIGIGVVARILYVVNRVSDFTHGIGGMGADDISIDDVDDPTDVLDLFS